MTHIWHSEKVVFMRIFIAALVLIFSFQSWTKADDISDFEIEGMSIGDSALDYFSEEEIKKNTREHYNVKTFTVVQNDFLPFFEIYDAVDFDYKTGDKNYIIWGLSGIIFYQHNVKKCYEKQDEIIEILSEFFKDEGKFSKKKKTKHDADKSGNSINTQIKVKLKSGDIISIHCNDYSKEHGGQDHLAVNIKTEEYNEFLRIAYE